MNVFSIICFLYHNLRLFAGTDAFTHPVQNGVGVKVAAFDLATAEIAHLECVCGEEKDFKRESDIGFAAEQIENTPIVIRNNSTTGFKSCNLNMSPPYSS